MDKFEGGCALLIVLSIAFFGYGGWYNMVTHYAFDREIGDYFENSDRASLISLKLDYFNKFIVAVEQEGLTSGQAAIYWQRPISDLGEQYKVAKSLQVRLEQLSAMDPNSMQYQQGMQQITTNEYCWFPLNTFYMGYALKHGAWGNALFPVDVVDRCDTND